MVKLEFQWGLWSHANMRHPSRWTYPGMQSFLDRCLRTQETSVAELLEPGRTPSTEAALHSHQRMILSELTKGLSATQPPAGPSHPLLSRRRRAASDTPRTSRRIEPRCSLVQLAISIF